METLIDTDTKIKHSRKAGNTMDKNYIGDFPEKNTYDDGNIPEIDLPQKSKHGMEVPNVQPLPKSERPRRDGPGGE